MSTWYLLDDPSKKKYKKRKQKGEAKVSIKNQKSKP